MGIMPNSMYRNVHKIGDIDIEHFKNTDKFIYPRNSNTNRFTMNTLILPILFIFVGNLIVPLTSEWCTVMKDVLKSRLVTVQDTKRQARRHYFWPSTYVDIPINYTKMEVSARLNTHKNTKLSAIN